MARSWRRARRRRRLSRQIATLASHGEDLVVVHGGGKQLTDLCRRLQIESIQHNGRRITDAETLKAAKMVFSAINRDLVAALTAKGLRAVGIASFDAQLVRCRRRSPIPVVIPGSPGNEMELVDFDLVGEIESIDPFFLRELWKLETVPVVSCLCADPTGQILNINADTLAAELAVAVGADRLISVSDVKGLYLDAEDPSTRIPEITARSGPGVSGERNLQGRDDSQGGDHPRGFGERGSGGPDCQRIG